MNAEGETEPAWVGCIGVGDGMLVELEKPRARDGVLNADAYWTYKGFYALNVQVT